MTLHLAPHWASIAKIHADSKQASAFLLDFVGITQATVSHRPSQAPSSHAAMMLRQQVASLGDRVAFRGWISLGSPTTDVAQSHPANPYWPKLAWLSKLLGLLLWAMTATHVSFSESFSLAPSFHHPRVIRPIHPLPRPPLALRLALNLCRSLPRSPAFKIQTRKDASLLTRLG